VYELYAGKSTFTSEDLRKFLPCMYDTQSQSSALLCYLYCLLLGQFEASFVLSYGDRVLHLTLSGTGRGVNAPSHTFDSSNLNGRLGTTFTVG